MVGEAEVGGRCRGRFRSAAELRAPHTRDSQTDFEADHGMVVDGVVAEAELSAGLERLLSSKQETASAWACAPGPARVHETTAPARPRTLAMFLTAASHSDGPRAERTKKAVARSHALAGMCAAMSSLVKSH